MKLRNRFFRPQFYHHGHAGVEIRRFDHDNLLIEEHAPTVEIHVLNVILQDRSALERKIEELEAEVERLNKALPEKTKIRNRNHKPQKR